jgi:arginine deiminase
MTFGVHSEVGKLRKVMVHRPDLSLRRLTPTNHDELLFDDVLWVERAQYEHDQFVMRMRERGVEVFHFDDLLAGALEDDDAKKRLVEVAASEYTVGLSLVDEVRNLLTNMPADVLAKHLIGGLTVDESGLDLGKFREFSLPAAALDDGSAFILPPLPNTLFTRDSSCWIFGGVSMPTTSPRSTARTRCSRIRTSSTGTRREATTVASTSRTSGAPRSRAATCSRSATARS